MESGESGIEANVDYHGRVAFLSLRSSAGTATRRTQTPDDIAPLTEVGRRVSLGGTLGARLGRGTVHLEGRYDRTESGVGGLPERAEVSLRLDRLALGSRGAFHLQANAEIRKSFLTGLGPVGLAASTGIEATLPYGLTIAWAAERNPFFLAIAGNGAWVHAVRIERRTVLPSFRRSGQRGIVYRDLNGNGRREAGESGVPGALVMQQGVQAVTAPDGVFRLDADASGGEAALDPMSLNAGWIAGRRSDVAGRLELAVVPVAPIVVMLSVADPQGIGVGTDTLGPAAVLARHESGRLWVARRSGADSATFDALPPGRYDLQLDLTEVGVPLTVVGSLPSFVVGAVPPEPIHVVLAPRQVHVRQLDSPPPMNPPGAR
jgi:hypothetical protein